MTRILIVDDDDAFRESLAETLTDLGHETIEASSGRDALRIFATDAPLDCVFLDFRMTDISGIGVLERLREMPSRSTLPVVVLTAFATSDNTIHAMRLGAFEHLTKPVGRDAIAALLAKIDESSESAPRDDDPRIEEGSGEPRLIGASDALREVQKQIGRAAASDSTVLITGETGTGKEVAARVLHDASKRRARAVRRDQLRGDSGGAARKRALRPHEGRVHRRGRGAFGTLRRGAWRDALAR